MKHLILFENFDYGKFPKTFYKLVIGRDIVTSILKNGLIPSGTPAKSSVVNGISGNWCIEDKHLNEWVCKNKWFGSPLQALLFFNAGAEQEIFLIKFTTSSENKVYVRDVDLMFKSEKKYKSSFTSDDENYIVTESFITGKVPNENIELVNNLGKIKKELSQFIIEPKSLLNFVMGKNNSYILTDKKISKSQLIIKFITYKLKGLLGF